ncbi:hypothetical protein GOP47_0028743 [Adiantum capillus-veneris]|nr:hypothetical protein GOP47_0028743 [Adiantum capillus-veneris]
MDVGELSASADTDLHWLLQARPRSDDLLISLYSQQPSERIFDALCAPSDRDFMLQTALEHPDWCAPFLKLGWYFYKHGSHRSTQYKSSMVYLLLAKRRMRTQPITLQVISSFDALLEKVATYTEWGLVCTEEEVSAFKDANIPSVFVKELLLAEPMSISLSEGYTPQLQLDSRARMVCPMNASDPQGKLSFTKLPRFFQWVLPFRLAVMSTPRNAQDIKTLASAPLSFGRVVTLTEEEPLPSEWFEGLPIENIFLPVPNYKAPMKDQVDQFIDIVSAGHRTLVHCGGGKGRAGTFIACYLAACGFTQARQEFPVYNASEVISIIRHFRPRSIETEEQEHFTEAYIGSLWKRKARQELHSSIEEPNLGLTISGKLDKSVRLVILCGLQGSGKSSFSRHMKDALGFTIISQDDMGTKSACEAGLAFAMRKNERVTVDKCNPSVDSRKQLLEIAFRPKNALCVFFDYSVDLCIQQADARVDHPTIPKGRASIPVRSTAKSLVLPTLEEGFTCIATVRSIRAARDLLSRLRKYSEPMKCDDPPDKSVEQVFVKFPRTWHLFNLGSATRDDLIMNETELCGFLSMKDPNIHIVLQEKIDGANLGITLDAQTRAFLVQNRSHYANSKSHTQFKKLDLWLQNHQTDLWNVLTCNNMLPPGQLVLFGEWVFAKHSIHYTKLPDFFVAFDVYDTVQEQFYSSSRLRNLLETTSLFMIQEFQVDCPLSKEAFERLVCTHSAYYDGMVEGVYVRRETDMWTVDRAKVVRPNFLCGNEHWSRGQITMNQLGRNQVE